MLNNIPIAEWLTDGNEKHGEGLCVGFVPDLQCTAGTKADICTANDSPKQ